MNNDYVLGSIGNHSQLFSGFLWEPKVIGIFVAWVQGISLKRYRDKFQYPVPAEAKLGPVQLNPQLFGFIIFKMEEEEYLPVWHILALLIRCMTLSQNNEAGKILYKR